MALVPAKIEAEAFWRSMRRSVRSGPEVLMEYSPAGRVLPSATKSKGILTTRGSWAWATRVDAMAVNAITLAITKVRIFMGHSFFLFLLAASKLNCVALGLFAWSAPQHGAHYRAIPTGRQCTACEL